MARLKKAKPGMPRDWSKVESNARRLSGVHSAYVNDITGDVTLVLKTGATSEPIENDFIKFVPIEVLKLVTIKTLPDEIKKQDEGWRKIWPHIGN